MSDNRRIAWLCPWFSTLGAAYANALRSRGHDVLVVTTRGHFEDPPDGCDAILPAEIRTRDAWALVPGLLRRLRRFDPDLVVLDQTWDPRFLLLALGHPRVVTVHDAVMHDGEVAGRSWHRPLIRLVRRSTRIMAFSDSVAEALRSERPGRHVATVPLTSEMTGVEPAVAPAPERSDFCLLGRLHAYKNVPATLDVWREYTSSTAWAGDRLLLLGSGDPGTLPPHVEHRDAPFRFADVAATVARTKGSLVWYREASQSGVQVMSMQCGVAPLVSDVGGLPGYQGDVWPVVPLTRPDLLFDSFVALTDAETAAAAGMRARATYDSRYAPAAVAEPLERALAALVAS